MHNGNAPWKTHIHKGIFIINATVNLVTPTIQGLVESS
jgi:hypothetical protein